MFRSQRQLFFYKKKVVHKWEVVPYGPAEFDANIVSVVELVYLYHE